MVAALTDNGINAADFLEASKRLGSRPGLGRISALCRMLGDPQDAVPAVHIAGTNGKGSISAMLAGILAAAGYKTGLYQSPYIENLCECIKINGTEINRDELDAVLADLREPAGRMAADGDPPTEFEIETAAVYLWFQKSVCDIAVIETGMGGRLDATNVIRSPLVSVLTSISYDHMAYLGDTIAKITAEKCGILKPGGLAVCYPVQQDEAWAVIQERAAAEGNPLLVPDTGTLSIVRSSLDGLDIRYRHIEGHIPLIGRHQALNAVTAIEAALALRESRGLDISDSAIIEGLAGVKMPLRQEVVRREPVILLDGAHNPDGLAALVDTIRECLAGRKIALVMGMLADKDIKTSLSILAPLCGRLIACKPVSPRALDSEAFARAARAYIQEVSVNDNVESALGEALQYAGADGAVVVCGSLYLAGAARKAVFRGQQSEDRR